MAELPPLEVVVTNFAASSSARRSVCDVYIVGRTETGWAGLKTKVVET
jgi:hypothetical protein